MSWIQTITKAIETVFQAARKPFPSIPPILLLCEIMNRPGLSAIALAGTTIAKLQQNGFETGVNPCGLDNMNNKLVKIIAEETVKHIKTYGVTESVAAPADFSFIGTGGNAGGPVVLNLLNVNFPKTKGEMS